MRNIFFYFILVGFTLANISERIFCADLQTQILEDYQKGEISYHNYIVYRGYLIFAPEKLFEIYPGETVERAEKCGTGTIMELTLNWDILTEDEKSFFSQYIHSRPSLAYSLISPSGEFKIHYDLTGYNKVPSEDLNKNGIPDYAEMAALALDKARALYVDTLGFLPPYSDKGIEGPEFDVYLRNLSTIYGQTFFPPNIYIEIENDLEEDIFYTNGIEGLKVTCAHELHHAVQFSYIIRSQDFFFYETTAVLMEDMVYDEINDYYQYLPNFFGSTQIPFNTRDYFHEYGLSIWGHFLNKKYNRFIMREIWEEFKNNMPILDAIDETLKNHNSNFDDDLNEFYTWNYFTGSRADVVNYYDEGAEYPELEMIDIVPAIKDTIISISNKYLTPSYILLEGLIPTYYEINAKTSDNVNIDLWRNKIMLFEPMGPAIPVLFRTTDSLTNTTEIMNQEVNSEALIVSTSVARTDNKFDEERKYNMDIEVTIIEIPAYKRNSLRDIYPNPFILGEHDDVTIEFTLERTSDVKLLIISLSGRIVNKIEESNMSEGQLHKRSWDGLNENNVPVPSGIYFCQLRAGDFSETKKIAVIRR